MPAIVLMLVIKLCPSASRVPYPYFHDGGVQSLMEAVDLMGRLQLGREFTAAESALIVAFLKTLTGDQPSFALPVLPPSTDATPKPVPFDEAES